jgi:UDP-N-acetyl-2-amino-2-deoxyglucuronate dehydrogenase
MTDRNIGIALHGAGWVAHAHARSWVKNPQARIVSVSDIQPGRARQLVAEFGLDCPVRENYDDVLGDPQVEVVDVCSPSHLHARQGIAAAQAGKHVLVEKPMALNMEENRALRDAVAKAGVKSLTSFVLRWNPALQTIKSLVESGAIGRVFHVQTDYWHGIKPTHHAWDLHSKRATAGNALLLAGCHAVDALRWLTGDEAVEVEALGNNQKGLFEYDANVVALVRFKNGIIGKTSTLLDCEMPYTFNVDVVGTEGTIRNNRVWSKKLFPGQNGWTSFPTILPDSADVSHHPFDAEMAHFLECILQDRESHCCIADAYHTHELCLAVDRSIANGGRPVKLPLD